MRNASATGWFWTGLTDNASGRDAARPELTELLRFARDGDTVGVHSMHRLAANLDDLHALVQGLTRKGVRVEFVGESLVSAGEDSPIANPMGTGCPGLHPVGPQHERHRRMKHLCTDVTSLPRALPPGWKMNTSTMASLVAAILAVERPEPQPGHRRWAASCPGWFVSPIAAGL
jgi:hypothetical protein